MINFQNIELNEKKRYNECFFQSSPKGCEYSFGNLFLWGHQEIAFLHNHFVLYSSFNNHCFYPFPVGKGDKKAVLEAIFEDAKERGVCPCMTGLNEEAKEIMETLYPGQFYFHADRSGFDYVYDINDLADLKGRKLHRKRNHLKHFKKLHPNYKISPITPENMDKVRAFVSDWYKTKLSEHPEGDYQNEQAALEKAFTFYTDLEMEGLLLEENDEVLGFTMASPMSPDTFDVHFEKARGDIDGAYTTINSEFANYIRTKYPHVRYLDREEDMGIPGLRKAKMSYFPHHLVKKYRALPLRFAYSYTEPTASMLPTLRALWKDGFGDNDAFLDTFFSTAFDATRCRVAIVDPVSEGHANIAAVLYWFDCSIDGQRIAYVYAVTTAKQFRGHGACHMLLKDTHNHLRELGYTGVVLVPGNDALVSLYEGCEYETCTKRSRIECAAIDGNIEIHEIEKEEYAALRREFLPKLAVIQENENLDFLAAQAKFFIGGRIPNDKNDTASANRQLLKGDFLLAGTIENENLYGIELLGDVSLASGIVHALGCKDGSFFTPGKDEAFAMYHKLTEEAVTPSYFGFAFD